MPLIEFKCFQNHATEKIMTFAQAEGVERILCPECMKTYAVNQRYPWARRTISAAAVVFKGNGFTPRFHGETDSHIGGVPVKQGDDPVQVAKKVVANHGGGKRLFNGLTK